MSWDIPLTDVVITDGDRQAVAACLEGGWLTMGPRTRRFEEALASWTGAPQAVTVSSGTPPLPGVPPDPGLPSIRRPWS